MTAHRPHELPSSEAASGVIVRHGRNSLVRLREVDAPPTPRLAMAAWLVLLGLWLAMTAHQLLGWGGERSDTLFNHHFNNAIMYGSAAMVLWRAQRLRAERLAWALLGIALVVYASGDFVWTTWYSDSDATVTAADVFYLGYFPFAMAGLALLVRSRISRFELDRWIDGIAAALLVAAPGVVLILEPTIRESSGDLLTVVVSVAYPTLDLILLGAAIGVIALAGWQPGGAWLCLSLGLGCFVWADAIYSVQNLRGTYVEGQFDFLWAAAAILTAAAAWLRPLVHEEVQAWGWRAIALPMMCQVAPTVLMILKNEPVSEQVLMNAVLMIVVVQLVVSRPRSPAEQQRLIDARAESAKRHDPPLHDAA